MKRIIAPSFCTMLALLAGGEIAMRLFLSADFTGSFEYGFNQTAGFEEHADGTVHLLAGRARKFHPQTFARQRPAGVFRIFVIGDSVEYYDDAIRADPYPKPAFTYPALVGGELHQRELNAESFNLAVAGDGVERSQIVLRQALNYEPSLMVLKISDGNAQWEAENFERAQEFRSWHPKNWLRKSYLIQALTVLKEERFLNRMPYAIQTANRPGPARPLSPTNAPPVDIRQNEHFCSMIKESIELARERHVPVLLLTQVWMESNPDGQLVPSDHGMSAFAQELCGPGVSFLSMKQLFSSVPPESLGPMFLDHTHLKHPGHQLIAQALADKILADRKAGVAGEATPLPAKRL